MTHRVITDDERALIERLLAARPHACINIADAVEEIDNEGSLKFRHNWTSAGKEQEKFSVEAQFKDVDEIWIHALLFLIEGEVDELEFYKDDSSKIIKMPKAQEWEIIDLA